VAEVLVAEFISNAGIWQAAERFERMAATRGQLLTVAGVAAVGSQFTAQTSSAAKYLQNRE
jgi:hypothetical protein